MGAGGGGGGSGGEESSRAMGSRGGAADDARRAARRPARTSQRRGAGDPAPQRFLLSLDLWIQLLTHQLSPRPWFCFPAALTCSQF